MKDEYKQKIGIPDEHELVQTATKWEQRKGKDTDTYWYDEVNTEGDVVAKYVVKDATSIYPPFGNSVTWEKID
ncbi:hypothetical protein [Shewanella sp. Isolate8]|uniref:hypothetical protein n=1 Tax=Shewanella sp. Isolate8 TaxID=2908529 RepID=UPI001EFD211B|nr:hypothetical protein [Shewanella sp. Isolate8]MCG9747243.1 hypothetical protein [Shewanella sp. Isolate8]